MARMLKICVLDIEDTEKTGNKAYDLTRLRKGFFVSFVADASSFNDKCLYFCKRSAQEVDDSMALILKNNNGVISYNYFKQYFKGYFVERKGSKYIKEEIDLSSFNTLRSLYKKIEDRNYVFSFFVGNDINKSDIYELFLRTGIVRRNNFTIICIDKLIPVVDGKLLFLSNEDNKIASFDNEIELNDFLYKKIIYKYKRLIESYNNNQLGYEFYMAYFNRIEFNRLLEIVPELKLVCVFEDDEKSTVDDAFAITDPDDFIDLINTYFYFKKAYFTVPIMPFNIDEILLNRKLYDWNYEYKSFFKYICDTFINKYEQKD